MSNQSPCESLPEADKAVIDSLNQQIAQAKEASLAMSLLSEAEKNSALELIERELRESVSEIVKANEKDLTSPDNADLSNALKDRLKLDSERIMGMATGIRKIMAIPDPIGQVLEGWQHPNGMKVTKYRVPLGVIGIIYEARPNVTTDAIALAIKSGNSVVLRGSRQAWNTNLAIMEVVNRALKQTKVPQAGIQYLADKSREGCRVLLRAEGLIDLVIPRGGEDLNKFVTDNSLIPVLGAGGGTCHTYIDQFADPEKAIAIAVNAKTSRPSVCNACETILVHKSRVDDLLQALVETLQSKGVEIFGDQVLQAKCQGVQAASEEDWGREYLDLQVAIKVVDDIAEAIQHINFYSTGHSEAIVTEDVNQAEIFKRMINSACVYVNASTRFTDGEEFGFGAEMGISTQKMHARGPIGARELCSYKFVIEGNGQIR
ncbi:MAG: glutamate-5-semialdehyde dehydrogenase [Candidatus Melainabacteria bacterium]|nr:glutamate-5-semialdehyde dehydrogenase [Candidatus Melainabacteria bacterium]